VQLSPIVTSVGCSSSMYTSWLIHTLLPIATPRSRCSQGRKLNPPGTTKAILPANLPSRTGKINGSSLSFLVAEMLEIWRKKGRIMLH
jgi:hypothetical protein